MNYPEEDIIKKIKKGDICAFEELISAYQKRIYNIVLKTLNNKDDAYDITQEVCIKIYKSINKFNENSLLSTWIYRIAVNTCIDEMRRNKKNLLYITRELEDKQIDLPIENLDKKPDDEYEKKEIRTIVRDHLHRLDAKYKIIIILKDIYGYSYEEISKILGINQNTVKSRLNRARTKLKESIKKEEPFRIDNV